MPPKSREIRKAAGYLPLALYEQLEKRAESHYNSVSREVVQIIAKVLQEDTEQQKQMLAQS
jgi:hypothetical protein